MRTMILNGILFSLLSVMLLYTTGRAQPDSLAQNDQKVIRKAESKYLDMSKSDQVFRFYEDTEISREEELNGHVMVLNGNLSVRGKINGDVLVVWGDVRVYNTGEVNGNITSVGGTVEVYDNGIVRGDMLETNVRNLIGKDRRVTRIFRKSYKRDRYGTIPLSGKGEDLIFKYNRVEGLFLGLQFPKQFVPEVGHFSTYGFIGYGFRSKDMRFQLGLDRWFIDPIDYRLEIGGEFHSLTDTKDLWRIPYFENTLAALLLREDFHDYFGREGFSLHISQNITPYVKGTVEYRNDDYSSLSNHASWSLFGGHKVFRPNPSIEGYEGNMRSVYAELLFDNRDDWDFTTTGWLVKLAAEVSSADLGGDFSFNRYLVDVRHFWPVTSGENLNFRVMIGSSEGDLPLQKNFELGGISTLRGLRFKELAGNSMLLVNLEYRIHSRFLGSEIPLIGEHFSLILFTDVGDAWRAPNLYDVSDRLKMLKWKHLKHNVGIALADPDGDYRLNIARRTDVSDNDFVITFRISQPF